MTTEQDVLYRKNLVPLDRDTYIVRTQAGLKKLMSEMKKHHEIVTVEYTGAFTYPCVVTVRAINQGFDPRLVFQIRHLKAHLRTLGEKIDKIYRNDPEMAKDFPWISAVGKAKSSSTPNE